MEKICLILLRTLNPNFPNELELDYISEILVVLKATINPLSPSIHIQILQADFLTFP